MKTLLLVLLLIFLPLANAYTFTQPSIYFVNLSNLTNGTGSNLTISVHENPNFSYWWNFSDGTKFLTSVLKGDKGDTGSPGSQGIAGINGSNGINGTNALSNVSMFNISAINYTITQTNWDTIPLSNSDIIGSNLNATLTTNGAFHDLGDYNRTVIDYKENQTRNITIYYKIAGGSNSVNFNMYKSNDGINYISIASSGGYVTSAQRIINNTNLRYIKIYMNANINGYGTLDTYHILSDIYYNVNTTVTGLNMTGSLGQRCLYINSTDTITFKNGFC